MTRDPQASADESADGSSVAATVLLGGHSEVGDRRRNEDSFTVRHRHAITRELDAAGEQAWLVAVADGLGGHPRGADASHAAISAVDDYNLDQQGRFGAEGEGFTDLFREAFDRVELLRSHSRGLSRASALYQPLQPATTLTVAAGLGDGSLWVANLGDSRAYVMAPDGELLFASEPHNTREGYLSKCLGDFPFTAPDVTEVVLPADRSGVVVVCATDGTWVRLGAEDDDAFARHVARVRALAGDNAEAIARRVTRDAVVAGGPGTDNATAAVALLTG